MPNPTATSEVDISDITSTLRPTFFIRATLASPDDERDDDPDAIPTQFRLYVLPFVSADGKLKSSILPSYNPTTLKASFEDTKKFFTEYWKSKSKPEAETGSTSVSKEHGAASFDWVEDMAAITSSKGILVTVVTDHNKQDLGQIINEQVPNEVCEEARRHWEDFDAKLIPFLEAEDANAEVMAVLGEFDHAVEIDFWVKMIQTAFGSDSSTEVVQLERGSCKTMNDPLPQRIFLLMR